MCASTIESYSTFGKNVKVCGKTQVESWVFGFSLISDYFVYLIDLSLVTFPRPPGPTAAAAVAQGRAGGPGPHGGAGGPAGPDIDRLSIGNQ